MTDMMLSITRGTSLQAACSSPSNPRDLAKTNAWMDVQGVMTCPLAGAAHKVNDDQLAMILFDYPRVVVSHPAWVQRSLVIDKVAS